MLSASSAEPLDALPDAPNSTPYPDAVPIAVVDKNGPMHIEADRCSVKGSVYVLDGHALVVYKNRTLRADHIEYDKDSGDAQLTGHLLVTGGENDERIQASHGTINLPTQKGRFYDVSGSVGLRQRPVSGADGDKVYSNGNPFLFSGRVVEKSGPKQYEIYDGAVTSCQLMDPDWLFSASEFSVDGEKARANNSIFRVRNFPLLWFPYVTHPVNANERQSGVLIPVLGDSSSKGLTVGEQIYWSINRSTDMTVGTIYYSDRGWEQSASLRYRGLGDDKLQARYSGLQDRGYTPSGGVYTNQSGQDVTFSVRRDFTDDANSASAGTANSQLRAAADVEYLSSFLYREAFSTNFNQAVSSDVVSTIYGTHLWNGMALSAEGDRYQGEKRVASATQAEQQVHIFHAPAVEFTTTDHELGTTGIEWNLDSSVAMLKRIQPDFVTGGMIERVDLRPEIAYPFGAGGWRVRPSFATRDTFYSRSRLPQGTSAVETENLATLNRSSVEAQLDLRPPVLERTFDSGFVRRLLRHDVKHTIEPELTYRYASGVDNFSNILRFDAVDVASDTNEVEYGATQRLFLRQTNKNPCRDAGSAADATEILTQAGVAIDGITEPGQASNRTDESEPVCGNREWISWRVAQKYFFNPSFGGAVADGRRNIFTTTLDFSGIAFLTEPRNISPLVSRLRVRTSEKTDVEWDVDYDTGAKKFTANNIYADVHQGDLFAGVSYARLNAPGRSYVEGVASSVADFQQMRVTLGFGKPTKAGLSAAANAGVDLDLGSVQYGAVQTSYNWNCCGVSFEYRKYELGSARNENVERFNFTLSNIGSAGNIRHSDQIF